MAYSSIIVLISILRTSRIRKRRHKDPSCVRAPSIRLVIVVPHCTKIFRGIHVLLIIEKRKPKQLTPCLLIVDCLS